MTTTIRAGKLRDQVEIQQAIEVKDGQGGRSTTWSTIETVWAHVRHAREMEKFNAGRLGSVITHVITMRWTPNITEDRQLLFGARELQVVSVNNVDERGCVAIVQALEAR